MLVGVTSGCCCSRPYFKRATNIYLIHREHDNQRGIGAHSLGLARGLGRKSRGTPDAYLTSGVTVCSVRQVIVWVTPSPREACRTFHGQKFDSLFGPYIAPGRSGNCSRTNKLKTMIAHRWVRVVVLEVKAASAVASAGLLMLIMCIFALGACHPIDPIVYGRPLPHGTQKVDLGP